MELPSFEPLFGVKDLKLAPSLGSTPELFHIIACCDFRIPVRLQIHSSVATRACVSDHDEGGSTFVHFLGGRTPNC